MNEIRNLIVGLDFGREYTQICYFDRKAGEPRSLSLKAGASLYEAPTVLCRRPEQGDYVVGPEAGYFVRETGGELIDGLYEISGQETEVSLEGVQERPGELLFQFLRGMLRYLGVADILRNTKCLAIASEEMDPVRVKNFRFALNKIGFADEQVLLVDYDEAFYYYAMSLPQKREILNRSVGWYAFQEDEVSFRKMYAVSPGSKPLMIRLGEAQKTILPREDKARDAAFLEFIQKTLGKQNFSSLQVTGKGFSQDWAKQSVKQLCFQRRKVYSGNNLFARGACCAAKEKCEDRELKNIRFLSDSLVMEDVGMEMQVMGSPVYYPLVTAGQNWYECHKHVEFLLNKTEELVFIVGMLGKSEKTKVSMPLQGLPKRPPKTTRILLELSYLSPKECHIRAVDLGFGEFFPSSGKVWEETVSWQEENG